MVDRRSGARKFQPRRLMHAPPDSARGHPPPDTEGLAQSFGLVQIHHGQTAAAGQHIAAASRMFPLNRMVQFCAARQASVLRCGPPGGVPGRCRKACCCKAASRRAELGVRVESRRLGRHLRSEGRDVVIQLLARLDFTYSSMVQHVTPPSHRCFGGGRLVKRCAVRRRMLRWPRLQDSPSGGVGKQGFELLFLTAEAGSAAG